MDATTTTGLSRAERAALDLLRGGPRVGWALRRDLRRSGHGGAIRSERAYGELMAGLEAKGLLAGWVPGPTPMRWYRLTAAGAAESQGTGVRE